MYTAIIMWIFQSGLFEKIQKKLWDFRMKFLFKHILVIKNDNFCLLQLWSKIFRNRVSVKLRDAAIIMWISVGHSSPEFLRKSPVESNNQSN